MVPAVPAAEELAGVKVGIETPDGEIVSPKPPATPTNKGLP